jgi:hypothetical protein
MIATTTPAPVGKMLLVFLGTLIALNLALAAFQYLLPDIELPTSMGILLMMAAAMAAGQIGGQNVKRRLTLKEKAVFSVVATALGMAVTLGMLWAIFAWHGVPFSIPYVIMAATGEVVPQSEINEFLPYVIGFMALISLLITFLAVGWGARTQVKALERKAAKAG